MSKETAEKVEEREEKERLEYLEERKVWIEGEKNASDKLNNILFLLSTGAFIYTQTLFQKNSDGYILLARFCFLLSLISIIMIYFLSGKSNALSLDNYDYEYKNDEEDVVSEQKVVCYNLAIENLEYLSVFFVIFGIVLIFISYVF